MWGPLYLDLIVGSKPSVDGEMERVNLQLHKASNNDFWLVSRAHWPKLAKIKDIQGFIFHATRTSSTYSYFVNAVLLI